MICCFTCLSAFAFIIAMIYFHTRTSQSEIVLHYKKNMPTYLQSLYEKISKERLHISLKGYSLGLLLSLLLILYNFQMKREKMSNSALVCLTVSVTFITNYFYYILSPKTDWMLNKMNNQEQVKAWLQMYREMQKSYHWGLVFGIIGAGLLAYAFRC